MRNNLYVYGRRGGSTSTIKSDYMIKKQMPLLPQVFYNITRPMKHCHKHQAQH